MITDDEDVAPADEEPPQKKIRQEDGDMDVEQTENPEPPAEAATYLEEVLVKINMDMISAGDTAADRPPEGLKTVSDGATVADRPKQLRNLTFQRFSRPPGLQRWLANSDCSLGTPWI